MQEITLADHADYPVALIDYRDRADAALGQQSRYCRYRRILIDRDHFTRHYVASAHRNALGLVRHAARYRSARIDLDQPVRVEDECLFHPAAPARLSNTCTERSERPCHVQAKEEDRGGGRV